MLNLDAMSSQELREFHAQHDRASLVQAATFFGRRKVFIEAPRKTLRALTTYAITKATAQEFRLMGAINDARQLELVCDDLYDHLPKEVRW